MLRAYRWSMDEQLRAELLRRVEKDQVARKALDLDGMREADSENLPWLKGVVAAHGWPGASLVGSDGDDFSDPVTVTCPECGREMTVYASADQVPGVGRT